MPNYAACYCRCSSEMQVEKDLSISAQLSEIRKYAESNSYILLDDYIYIEEGASAKTTDRPQFQKMISDSTSTQYRPFDTIIAYDSSRFSRSREDSIVYKSILRKKGINLLFVKQNFDDSVSGKLLEGIVELFDEIYIKNLSELTLRGLCENSRKGYYNGGTPPYGYARTETTNAKGGKKYILTPDATTSAIVKNIYQKKIQGYGYRSIAYDLNRRAIPTPRNGNAWTASTIYSILKNNQGAYLGTYTFNKWNYKDEGAKYKDPSEWIVVKDAWEPILTPEVVDAVNKTFGNKKGSKPLRNREHALTGYLTCGVCGATLNATTSGRKRGYRYYRCNRSRDSGTCNLRMLPQRLLEKAVHDDFSRRFLNFTNLRSLIKSSVSRAESCRLSLSAHLIELMDSRKDIERKKENIVNMIEAGVIEPGDVKKRLDAYNTELLRIEIEFNKEREASIPPLPFDYWDIEKLHRNLSEKYKSDDSATLSSIAKDFICNILVYNDHMEITYSWRPYENKENRLDFLKNQPVFEVFSDGAEDAPWDIRKHTIPTIEAFGVVFWGASNSSAKAA